MKKIKIIFLSVVLLCILLFIVLFFNKKDSSNISINKDDCTQVYFYDLGNSNIEIIKSNNYVFMINTGLEEDRDMLLDYFEQLGIEKIDYLIITNRNDEYMGNVSFVLNNYIVDYLYINDYDYSSKYVDDLFNNMDNTYADEIVLSSNEIIQVADLTINIYPCLDNEFTMEDKSFIVNIVEGDNSIYITSNISSKRLNDINSGKLFVSENKSLIDKDFNYYIYDGNDKIKSSKELLERDIVIYMNKKEFIVE